MVVMPPSSFTAMRDKDLELGSIEVSQKLPQRDIKGQFHAESVVDGEQYAQEPWLVWWFALCGVDVLGKNASTMYNWYLFTCYTLGIPYVAYMYILTGEFAGGYKVHGKIVVFVSYYVVGNLTPPLCYIWATQLYQNKSFHSLMNRLKYDDRFKKWGTSGKNYRLVITQLLGFTALIFITYVIWLNTLPGFWSNLPLALSVYFNYLGFTFPARLMLVFLCYMSFLMQCSSISVDIDEFKNQLDKNTSVQAVADLFDDVNQKVSSTVAGWRLFFIAVVFVPIVEFVLQVVMVNIDGLSYQNDYFFLVYELHYFILAWIVIYYAAMINSKWRDTADLVAIHFSKNLMTVKIDKPEEVGGHTITQTNHLIQVQALLALSGKPKAPVVLGLRLTQTFAMRMLYVCIIVSGYMVTYIHN